ncbi:hypothetical protein [Streptomyces sp. HNM0574]|uniref:hypothetical protein n=1 Tax=Streptomyces sp. HNM0574 TaxID=2714954 RepID=UPI00146DFBA8|nr:hypothetical protein [Streptomyces sp. HNM0574]NLU69315.1 hypothetical protein [Streptomyces sp. HNM0574]
MFTNLSEAVQQLLPRAMSDLERLIALRSLSDPGRFPTASYRTTVGHLMAAFSGERAWEMRTLRTPSAGEAVLGQSLGDSDVPTVLLYGHYGTESESPASGASGAGLPVMLHIAVLRAPGGDFSAKLTFLPGQGHVGTARSAIGHPSEHMSELHRHGYAAEPDPLSHPHKAEFFSEHAVLLSDTGTFALDSPLSSPPAVRPPHELDVTGTPYRAPTPHGA